MLLFLLVFNIVDIHCLSIFLFPCGFRIFSYFPSSSEPVLNHSDTLWSARSCPWIPFYFVYDTNLDLWTSYVLHQLCFHAQADESDGEAQWACVHGLSWFPTIGSNWVTFQPLSHSPEWLINILIYILIYINKYTNIYTILIY